MNFKFETLTGYDSAFFDSGTTFVYFGYSLYEKYMEQFTNYCQKDSLNCGGNANFHDCFDLPEDPAKHQ